MPCSFLGGGLSLPGHLYKPIVGAVLLFSVQPLVGKLLLPLLGGAPSVWNTVMVFFQAMLLAGYAYAHVRQDVLGPFDVRLGDLQADLAEQERVAEEIRPGATIEEAGGISRSRYADGGDAQTHALRLYAEIRLVAHSEETIRRAGTVLDSNG